MAKKGESCGGGGGGTKSNQTTMASKIVCFARNKPSKKHYEDVASTSRGGSSASARNGGSSAEQTPLLIVESTEAHRKRSDDTKSAATPRRKDDMATMHCWRSYQQQHQRRQQTGGIISEASPLPETIETTAANPAPVEGKRGAPQVRSVWEASDPQSKISLSSQQQQQQQQQDSHVQLSEAEARVWKQRSGGSNNSFEKLRAATSDESSLLEHYHPEDATGAFPTFSIAPESEDGLGKKKKRAIMIVPTSTSSASCSKTATSDTIYTYDEDETASPPHTPERADREQPIINGGQQQQQSPEVVRNESYVSSTTNSRYESTHSLSEEEDEILRRSLTDAYVDDEDDGEAGDNDNSRYSGPVDLDSLDDDNVARQRRQPRQPKVPLQFTPDRPIRKHLSAASETPESDSVYVSQTSGAETDESPAIRHRPDTDDGEMQPSSLAGRTSYQKNKNFVVHDIHNSRSGGPSVSSEDGEIQSFARRTVPPKNNPESAPTISSLRSQSPAVSLPNEFERLDAIVAAVEEKHPSNNNVDSNVTTPLHLQQQSAFDVGSIGAWSTMAAPPYSAATNPLPMEEKHPNENNVVTPVQLQPQPSTFDMSSIGGGGSTFTTPFSATTKPSSVKEKHLSSNNVVTPVQFQPQQSTFDMSSIDGRGSTLATPPFPATTKPSHPPVRASSAPDDINNNNNDSTKEQQQATAGKPPRSFFLSPSPRDSPPVQFNPSQRMIPVVQGRGRTSSNSDGSVSERRRERSRTRETGTVVGNDGSDEHRRNRMAREKTVETKNSSTRNNNSQSINSIKNSNLSQQRTAPPFSQRSEPAKIERQLLGNRDAAPDGFSARESEAPDNNSDDLNDHLSDVPSNVDPDTRDRYLHACRVLKAALIDKKPTNQKDQDLVESLLEDDTTHGLPLQEKRHVIEAVVETLSQQQPPQRPQQPMKSSSEGWTAYSDFSSFFVDNSASSVGTSAFMDTFAFDIATRTAPQDKNNESTAPKSSDVSSSPPSDPPGSYPLQRLKAEATHRLHNLISPLGSEDERSRMTQAISDHSSSLIHARDAESPFKILGLEDIVGPTVLTPVLMEALRGFFPYTVSEANFWLKYSSERDGDSIVALIEKIKPCKHTILCVETKDGHVFGAFCSTPWCVQSTWYGSGEAFLWRLKKPRIGAQKNPQSYSNASDNEIEIYPYTGAGDMIQYCTKHTLAVGGAYDWYNAKGGCPYDGEPPGIGLMIDGDLKGGETNSCTTFANPRLGDRSAATMNEFLIQSFEVWTVTPCSNMEDAEELEMRNMFLRDLSAGR